jgi:hypothetical protein
MGKYSSRFVTVPSRIVVLAELGVIGTRAAKRKLELIEYVTAPVIRREAHQALGRRQP